VRPRSPTRHAPALAVLLWSALGGSGALAPGAAFAAAPALGASTAGAQAKREASPPRALGGTRMQASVSTNWAGYVALPSTRVGSRFSSVSGSWTQPKANCTVGREAYSAAWVGLGGYNERSRALEQIGADADCTRSGAAVYTAWYELLPAGPVNLKLHLRPGNRVAASVTVRGQDVTLRIRDLSTGAHFSTTKRVAVIDASSAEWIVEAPSACVSADTCTILPLTDFGQVAFSSATATAAGHTGPVADPDWYATALELQQQSFGASSEQAGVRAAPVRTLTFAAPSASATPDGAFTVSWGQRSVQIERPSPPTLPGFGGGPP